MFTKEQLALLSPAMRQELALEHAKKVFWHSVLAQQASEKGHWITERREYHAASKACALVIAFSTPV